MAGTTQYLGISYPTNTDYVKDGASAMQTIATGFDTAVAIPTYNNQTGTTYTFVLADAAKVVSSNSASGVTFTIPPQADVAWATGTTLTVANFGAGSVTIAGGSGVTVTNAGSIVSQYGSASIIRTGSNAWTVIPFAGGVAPLSDSAVSGTTGSPTTATFTISGTNYKAYIFKGSGSITFSKAGLCDVLVVGGGGGASAGGDTADSRGGAGAGGANYYGNYYVGATTITASVGAGGAVGAFAGGVASYFDDIVSVGGGRGSGTGPDAQIGASGAGGGCGSGGGHPGAQGLNYGIGGFSGGDGSLASGYRKGGGGGGAGGAGVTATVKGDGGVGFISTIIPSATATSAAVGEVSGTDVYYGGGGGGGSGTAGQAAGTGGLGGGGNGGIRSGTAAENGTANTGGGGGGTSNATAGAGGSGVVIVRVLA